MSDEFYYAAGFLVGLCVIAFLVYSFLSGGTFLV